MFLLVATIVVIIANLLLGLVTLMKNPRSSTNRLFMLLTLILSSWAAANYFSVVTTNPEEIIFWLRPVMIVTGIMFPTLYLLARAFPRKSIDLSRVKLILIVGFSLITSALSATPLIFERVEVKGNSVSPIPGPAMPLFAFNVLLFLLLALYTLIKKFRSFVGIERTQLKFFILGISLTFLLATLTNFVAVNLLKTTYLVAIGPLFSIILVVFISYAIIKHRFLDIGVLAARTVSFTILTFLIAGYFALTLFILGQLIISISFNTSQLILAVFLSLAVAFAFQPLRKSLELETERIFFKDAYDPEEVLGSISKIMAMTIELDKLVHDVLHVLLGKLHLEFGSLILVKDRSVSQVIAYKYDTSLLKFQADQLIFLLEQKPLVVFDDLEESSLKQLMRQNNIGVFMQLFVKDNLVGILMLGHKLSGDVYSSNDLRVLEILGPELAIAVQNARQYEEIKQFSQKLQVEVQKATHDLQIANERLKELDDLKSEFVSVASHELRTPMTAIKSYLWMALAGKGGEITDKQKYYLDRAYISTDRLIKLVNDLLNVSRIESGRLSLDVSKMDLGQFIEEVISEVRPRVDEMGISIINDYPKDKPLSPVIADSDKLKEVLINLIGNSIKFTSRGGMIRIWFEDKDGMITTNVTDNGAGIAVEDLPKLFQKFGLVRDSYVTNQKASQGTGLGLYISKSIVELHKGKMWAQSEGRDKGATFSFSLEKYSDSEFDNFRKQYANKEGLGIIHSELP